MISELQTTESRPKLIPSTRFTLALLISCALFIQYSQRVSLSMAIVCMVNRTNTNSGVITSPLKPTIKYGEWILQDKQFILTEFQQQILLAAQWFGGFISLIPGGSLAMKIGAKRTFAYCILLSSIASSAMASIYLFPQAYFIIAVILRIIVGIGHAALFPATYTFWSMWAVPLERATLTAIGFCSNNLGTAVTMFVGGLLCRYVSAGWVYIFLISGLCGFIWLPLWIWLVADSPTIHRTISEQERNYICERNGLDKNEKPKKTITLATLPWKKILRSKAIAALFIIQFCNLFGLFFFYTNIGKILTEIHRISPQNAGYVSAGGFLLMPIVSLSSGIFADKLVRTKKMSITNVRKLANALTTFTAAICMIILCFCDHTNQILGTLTILLLLASSAIAYGAGYVVNFGDIVPMYSTLIFAILSTISTAGAVGSNILAGIIIKRPILEDWRKLFIIFSIIYTIGGIPFLFYGSGVARKWATFNSQKAQESPEAEPLTTLSHQVKTLPTTKTIDTE